MLRIVCATVADCAGRLLVLEPPSDGRRHAKPVLIASSALFFITGHHAAMIQTTLTRAGRALISAAKPLMAIAQLTTVGPPGRAITKTVTCT